MKTLKLMAVLVASVALIASCTTFKASGLSYSLKGQKTTVLGEFKTEIWVNEFLGAPAGAKLFKIVWLAWTAWLAPRRRSRPAMDENPSAPSSVNKMAA